MEFITNIFGVIGIPLGWILGLLYSWMGNYFLALFLFTLLMRAATFPIALRSQKTQAARLMLQPRIERLQKKYANDRQTLQRKQQELMEKEGVSMTAGCLPQILQMVLLFAMIAVIYAPLTHLGSIPKNAVNVIKTEAVAGEKSKSYPELTAMRKLDTNLRFRHDLVTALTREGAVESGKTYTVAQAEEIIDTMTRMKDHDFNLFGIDLLRFPNDGPNMGFGILWLLPILSWALAMVSSWLMQRYQKQGGSGEAQPGQGCMTFMTMALMPAFSLFVTFTVPGAVGLYWLFSSLIAIAQTLILNKLYDPRKIRAAAIAADEERRQQRSEDKKKLSQTRKEERSGNAERKKEWYEEED